MSAPVLLMPNSTGHFVMVSDTSKIGCGVACFKNWKYRKQRGKYHLPEHDKPQTGSEQTVSEQDCYFRTSWTNRSG